MSSVTSEEKLQQIAEIRQQLSQIKDVDILLENILSAARRIVNADAGSIYEYDESQNRLRIRYSQNDTQLKKLAPGEKLPYTSYSFTATTGSISGYCALNKASVNIPDVYNMGTFLDAGHTKLRPYNFNQENDLKTGYHTKSMLTTPLVMTNGKVLGVLQIINALDDDGEVVPFGKDAEFYVSYFAANVIQVYEYAYITKQLIERLVKMANYRDPRETGAHVERVSCFALEIYDRYAVNKGIPEDVRNKFRDNLKLAAKCHDLGKVGVPDKILKKEGKLNDSERSVMEGHTCVGAQIFTPFENDLDLMARDVCLHHHARWDGGERGYPGKFDYESYVPESELPQDREPISGEEIPLAARIVALADVYDALRHRRCYKEPWTLDDTVGEIRAESGKQFDPEVVDAFLQVINRLEAINKDIS
ncbi:MAG TPA: phosphohydrolase [Treponema sp.]|nr:phosphohydrolase [Treponema sp.]